MQCLTCCVRFGQQQNIVTQILNADLGASYESVVTMGFRQYLLLSRS